MGRAAIVKVGIVAIFIICFIAYKRPFGIPNALYICPLSPYHLFSLPNFLILHPYLIFLISNPDPNPYKLT